LADMEKLFEDVLANKGALKELELRFKVLMDLLEREGLVSKAEVERDFASAVRELRK
jgi:hypothetical protein